MSAFAFAHGSTFTGDADEVQAELERLRRTGGLTPRAVVVAARPKRSVLHPLIFNVDEKLAAERYYEERARKLIMAIVVRRDEAPTSVRANVRMVTDDGAAYVSVEAEGAREVAIARLRRDMAALSRQLRELELYPQLVMVLDEVLAA